jgi:hypothetical protein
VATHVRFFLNGKFDYFCDDDSPLGFIKNHLEEIGEAAYYALSPSAVHLVPFGVIGTIHRHPQNWGWILVFPASIWTSYEPPVKGEDPFLDDAYILDLVRRDAQKLRHGWNAK